ncbi:MAG: hypothetical protein HDR88_11170 [Bacteroides sp.]|nr:hypothetical protein [Bacteroides sp.]MBD5357548.1 hypothetical protein [Bacteroides sp.]
MNIKKVWKPADFRLSGLGQPRQIKSIDSHTAIAFSVAKTDMYTAISMRAFDDLSSDYKRPSLINRKNQQHPLLIIKNVVAPMAHSCATISNFGGKVTTNFRNCQILQPLFEV